MRKQIAARPPAPGSAPWAPHIVYAPLPRWPVIIPLSLLAGLGLAAWLMLDRGLLTTIIQLTSSL